MLHSTTLDMKKLTSTTALVICGLAVPLAAYMFFIGSVPQVEPAKAREMLSASPGGTVLVDVREESSYVQRHITGAVNWPMEKILAARSRDDIPAELKGRKLLFICNGGVTSAFAASKAAKLGLVESISVRGGMKEWMLGVVPQCPESWCTQTTDDSKVGPFPEKDMPAFKQYLTVASGFVVKPAYMFLSLLLAWFLRNRSDREGVALKFSLLAFFTGEFFCALNYLFYAEGSYLFEFLHSLGMAASFAGLFHAFITVVGFRLMRLHQVDRRCPLIESCGGCWKSNVLPCSVTRIYSAVALCIPALAAIPMLAGFSNQSYTSFVMGFPYGFTHPTVYQIFELRICPAFAVVLSLAAFVSLRSDNPRPPGETSDRLLSAAFGALSFSFFRLVLVKVYAEDQVWFLVWEELTEMMAILIVGWFMWVFMRDVPAAGIGRAVKVSNSAGP